jgi:hypothetical protein
MPRQILSGVEADSLACTTGVVAALSVALTPFSLADFTALALAGTAQLRDRHCLVEL